MDRAQAISASGNRSVFVRRHNINKGVFVACVASFGLLFSALLDWLAGTSTNEPRTEQGPMHYAIVILIGPVIETLIFQLTPYLLVRRRASHVAQLVLMVLPFALLHYDGGLLGVLNALFGGILLALTFLTWTANGVACAFWMALSVHMIYNTMSTLVFETLPHLG